MLAGTRGRGLRAVVRLVLLFSVSAVVRAIGVVQFGDQSIGIVAVDQILQRVGDFGGIGLPVFGESPSRL